MATVHLGRMLGPLGFSKVVAIKRLHDEIANDRELVTMFLDEARLAARLQHPNIVSVVDIVAEGSELLIVMEYVKGAAVSTLLDEAARAAIACPPRIAAAITCNVLAGLHHAHETTDSRGHRIDLVHRDVSPQNVLVGIDGVARVLDFGIAKARGKMHHTRKDHLKGKVPYMAPELLERHPVDRRADVYAAGVVLWEMLAGRRLFDGPIDQGLFARILTAPVPLISEVRHGVDRYDEVVARALHRDPNVRYQSAREMLLALEQCGPVASASEVAAWVEPLALRSLQARAPLVHAIETSAIDTPPEPIEEPAPRGRRAPLLFSIVFAAIGFGTVLLFFGTRQPPSAIVESTPDSGVALTPPIEPSASAPVVDTPPAPIPTDTRRRAAPPRPRKDCDPPYVLDSAGHRRWKLECVR
jgi:eukaryotic-like serine/threonine-protein kinase